MEVSNATMNKKDLCSLPLPSIRIISSSTKTKSENKQKLKISKSVTRSKRRLNTSTNSATDKINVLSQLTSPTLRSEDNRKQENIQSDDDIEKLLSANNDPNVYASLLDNYRYLIIPKSWSALELRNELNQRCLAFFYAHILKENNTLITVMRKSLIISKGALLHYSVHGLPVNIQDTILPPTLDSTKKLLSILHIFDKMQVCIGIGDDLGNLQSELLIKDNCRFWRHKDCSIVLLKSSRCISCTTMISNEE